MQNNPSSFASYVVAAIDLMERHSVRRESIDWSRFRETAIAEAQAATTIAECYPVIRAALRRLGDGHSFFLTPAEWDSLSTGTAQADATAWPSPKAERWGGPIGYVWVPHFNSAVPADTTRFADDLQRAIKDVDHEDLHDWIVDLRSNGGGNMWPMIAGLGPLLGDGVIGFFLYPNDVRIEWSYTNGAAIEGNREGVLDLPGALEPNVAKISGESYRLFEVNPAVAVLTGPRTASSGEAVTVAFQGRPRTRSFGASTCGVSTGNDVFSLSDGAAMFLTTCVMADRLGRPYGGAIPPDQEIAGASEQSNFQDPVVQAALAWLHTA
jgi:carboxyl-terminal processing protease